MSTDTGIVSSMERLIYLKSLPGAEELDSRTLARIIPRLRERQFKSGDMILSAGRTPASFHTIIDGSAEIITPDGRRYKAGPRHDVGMGLILARDKTGMDVVATENTLTLECPAGVIIDLMEDKFEFARLVIIFAAQSLLEIRRRYPDLMPELLHDANVQCPSRPLDLIEKLIVMRLAAPFRGRHLDGLMEMARRSHESRKEAGDGIWRLGDPAVEINILMCGEVSGRTESGQTFTIRKGQPLGNLEVLAGSRRWFDAVAASQCVILSIDVDAFYDVMEDRNGMLMDLIAYLSNNLIRSQHLMPDQPLI